VAKLSKYTLVKMHFHVHFYFICNYIPDILSIIATKQNYYENRVDYCMYVDNLLMTINLQKGKKYYWQDVVCIDANPS